MLSIHVVVKNINLEISLSFGRLRRIISTKVRAARAARLFFLIQPVSMIQPIRSLFTKTATKIPQICTFDNEKQSQLGSLSSNLSNGKENVT